MRYFLDISYKGTAYHGWQIQPNASSVQEVLNNALEILLRHKVETLGSGRTDAGVHAQMQMVHIDTDIALATKHIIGLNAILPNDVVCNQIYQVLPDAHARFDALSRSYEYHLYPKPNPFYHDLGLFNSRPLDYVLMNEASQKLLHHTNFTSFSKVHTDVANFECQITEAIWRNDGQRMIFHITANRFLRGMVRAIVGTLLEVGYKKLSIEEFESIILAQDRCKAGMAVSPQGLFLSNISYPTNLFLLQV